MTNIMRHSIISTAMQNAALREEARLPSLTGIMAVYQDGCTHKEVFAMTRVYDATDLVGLRLEEGLQESS